MRISRTSHIGTIILSFLGATAFLPAQTVATKDASVAAALTAGAGAAATIDSARPDPIAGAAPGNKAVKVTVDRLNVRARPGTSYEVVAKVNRDEKLTVVGKQGDWLEIVPPADTAAWCSVKFINADNKVTGHQVRVRSGPGIVFSAFATLPADASVTPVGARVGEWQKIKVPAAATVWIHGDFVIPVPPPPVTATKDEGPAVPGTPNEREKTDETPRQVPAAAAETEDAASKAINKAAAKAAVTVPIAGDDKKEKPEADKLEQPDAPPTEAAGGTSLPTVITLQDENQPANGATATGKGEPVLADKQSESGLAPDTPGSGNLTQLLPDSKPPTASHKPADATPATSSLVEHEGTLISLQSKATGFVSHALVRRAGDKTYLICYLISDAIDLREWENRRVRVYGKPLNYSGWKTQALKATGITLLRP